MTDFAKMAIIVGVLCIVTSVFAILGGSPVPGGFFLLSGLFALGAPIAGRMGLVEQMTGDFDKMVGTVGLGAAMGIGLAWLGMAGFAFNYSVTGGAAGFADQRLWWGVIGTLLSIAALGALIGGVLHFRQQRA